MSKKVRKVSRIDDPNIEAQIDEIIRVVNSLDARTEDADAKATVNTQPKLVFREFPSDPVFGNCEFVYDVTLRWYKADGAIMYEIRTDLNWGNESGRVYLGSALQYSFRPGQRYYTFYIKSINPAGKYSQGYDEIILEKPVPSIPDPPEAMPFFSAVKITPAPNHEQGILGHYAYVTIEGETDKVDIPIGSSHAYNAPSGTEMTIEMSAYDILGEGDKSAPVTASTLKLSDRDIPDEIIEPSHLVESLREDIDLTKTNAIDALAQISDLDSIVDDTIADLNAAKDKLTSAETEISNAKNRISTVETKIGEAETKIADIDDEIEAAKDRLTSAETEITGAKNRLASVETEVAGAKSRLSDAEDRLGTIDVEIVEAKDRISDVETDLLDAKNRLSDVEDEIVDTKDRLLGAESRLSNIDDEIADAKDRLTDAELRLTATETDLTDAKTRLTSVEESITDAEARLVDAENRLSNIDDEIADAKDRLTDAELRLTATETDLTDARTRLIEAENDLEGLEGVVSTHETKISNVEGELSTKVSKTEFNALAGTVSTQGTILAQHADQIAMKAEQSEVDTLSEAVASNTATLEVHATQIAARVTKEVYNLLEDRVEKAEGELVALADEISAKVSQTVFEDLQSRVAANEAELLVQAEAIQARVTQEVYDTLANRVTTVEGTLEVLPEQIALKASQSDVDALTGRVEDAEAELLVLATEISSKVSQTVFDTLSETVASQGTQITQNAAAIESKADQSVVDALSGTVAEHSTLISQTAEAIETKADKSVVDTLSDTVSSHTSTLQQHANMIAARVTTEVFNALEDRVEANEAELIVLADEISSKVSQSVFDALEQRVTTNEGTLAVHADMIAARVTSEVFDLLEERVETAEGQLTVLADEVSAKVSQTVFDALAGRVETTEGILEVLPDQINAKADQSVVDTLTERVEEAEGQLSVLATEIAARVTQTVFDELEGRVASNEGELTVLADEISSKVSQSVFDTLADRVTEAEGQLTVLAGEIEARVKQSVFDELVGRVEDAEATLTVLPGQIAAKADKTTVQQIDDELNTVKSNVATLTTNYNGIVARVEEVEGDINSLDDEITDVKSRTGQLEVRAGKIEASVSAIEEDVDDHGNRLASVENAVVEVLPGQIELKADANIVDEQGIRITAAEQNISALDGAITQAVTRINQSAILKPTGGKLWHFDTSLESTDGIKPLEGAVATLRPNEGKFGGAVAVEEGTVNLKVDPSNSNHWMGDSYKTERGILDSDFILGKATKFYRTEDDNRIQIILDGLPYGSGGVINPQIGDVYTISWTIKYVGCEIDKEETSFIIRQYERLEDGTHENYYTNDIETIWEKGNIARYSAKIEVRGVNGSSPKYVLPIFNSLKLKNFNYETDYILVGDIQLEQKPYATSFTEGTRPDGILAYPIALLEDYTIACYRKSHTDEDYKHVVKRSDGKVFVDGVEDSEYDVGWIAGRNLIQTSWLKNNSDIDYNTGLERSSGKRTIITEFIQVTPQQTYMLQRPVEQGNVGARYYDSDKNHIGSASLGSGRVFEVNIPDGCYYFKFIDEANTLDEGYKFEKGNKATHWTPAPEDLGYDGDVLMFSNQTCLIDELLILPYAATEEEIDTWYQAKGAFVDQAEINYQQSQIVQLADEISSKVSRDDFDALENTVTAMGTVVTQTAEAVEQKAELSTVTELGDNLNQVINEVGTLTTSYNSISARVESIEGDIDALTGEITGVKSRTSTLEQRADSFDVKVQAIESDVDGLDGRLSTAESNISANASAIELRATKSEVQDVSGKVTNLETWKGQFSVTPANINATVSAVNNPSTGLSAAWSEINQTPTRISQAVASLRSDVDDAIADVYSEISQTAGSINSTISDLQTNLEDQIAAGDSALSGQITDIEQTLTSISSTVADLGGDLGDISTQVTQLADRYSVKTQKTSGGKTYATGFVSGINEQNESEFAVLADKFRVFGSLNEAGDGTALFVVDAQTNKAYLNVEEMIAAGAIKAEHIEADEVKTLLLKAEAGFFDEADILKIDAQRIYVGDNIELGDNRVVVEGYEITKETVRITEDVHVDGANSTNANRNYSDSTMLYFGDSASQRALLKFDLPSGNITSATLRLYAALLTSSPLYIRTLKGDWDYQTVTWNNRPASDLIITTPKHQAGSSSRWVEIDITPVIQAWKQGQQNHGIEVYYGGNAIAYSSRYSNPAYHSHVVFTMSSEEKLPKAVFGDLEGLDWLDKTLPAGEHGFWGKGVRIIGDIASADKEGNYSVLSGGRLAFFRATQWDEHGNPIAHSKAMYPAQLVSGTANSGQVVDLYAQGYRFLSEPKIIVFPNFNRTYLAGKSGQDVWINWKVEAVDDDTPIFNPLSGAVKFRVRVETTVKGGSDLAAEDSLTRRRLEGTGQSSTAEGETGSGATSLRVKCTSYLRLRREYEDGFYYYQGDQEYRVYYRRKGASQWKTLGEHAHWDYRFGSPSGTPPMVNESKVFEVPLSPAGVYEIRVVLTTWGLYDSYVYIDTFKYRSQDTIGSVDESEMVNYLVIDGG